MTSIRKTLSLPLRYLLSSVHPMQFWFPGVLWAFFLLMIGVFVKGPSQFNIARGFLGVVIPLMAGIFSAGAIVEDSALELQFASPLPAWRMLFQRLGLTLCILAFTSLTFQATVAVLGIDLSALGNPLYRQLTWLIPSLAMLALGSAMGLLFTNTSGGSMFVGLVWIIQLVANGWWEETPIACYFYLFMGALAPEHPEVVINQIVLTSLAAAFLLITWLLLRKQERYI